MSDNRPDPIAASREVHETIVRRPRPVDDIGAALNRAFLPRHVMPGDFAVVLGKLETLG